MTRTADPVTEVSTLARLVEELQARVARLEQQLEREHAEVSEEVLLAISAACAAYLGHRARIKQVHLRRGATWVSQGRSAIQLGHADPRGRQ